MDDVRFGRNGPDDDEWRLHVATTTASGLRYRGGVCDVYECLVLDYITLHYIETIYSGLSKSNFKDHYGDATRGQSLGMTAEMCFQLLAKCCERWGRLGISR